MRYGFYLPVRGELATYDGVVETALHGEGLGFHSATIAIRAAATRSSSSA
jgi:hypothetical protein